MPISSAASAACAACTATPAYARIRAARVAVVGVGGVGSWAAEALARSGVAALTLIDLDHVAESNINRQVQALGATLGHGQGAGAARAHRRHPPGLRGARVEAFVEADNWPALLPQPVDVVIDACDQVRAKAAIGRLGAARRGTPLVVVGAAGGKRRPQAVEVDDLARSRTTRCSPRCASACASSTARARNGRDRRALRVLARAGGGAGAMPATSDGRPQLPRLRLERERDRHLRHGGRERCARMRGCRELKPPIQQAAIIVGLPGR